MRLGNHWSGQRLGATAGSVISTTRHGNQAGLRTLRRTAAANHATPPPENVDEDVVSDTPGIPPRQRTPATAKPYRRRNTEPWKSANNAQNGLAALLRNVMRLSVYRLNGHN